MRIGFIGLGKMGSRMAGKLIRQGHELVVWNRSQTAYDLLKSDLPEHKFDIATSLEELVKVLPKTRIVWVMLPARSTGSTDSLQASSGQAGSATEEILSLVSKYLEKRDILIDGGNANYKDTERRSKEFSEIGIRFLGIGVSGGIVAAKSGYPLMVGGDKSAYDEIKPILDSLSHPNGGHDYFGPGGEGHFIKMVHNAMEYGYMQSIGEGFGLLEESDYKFDLKKVAQLYQKGTLVSGFMMERTIEALGKDPDLSELTGVIGKATGETIWAVEEAEKKDLLFDIIRRSLEIRNESETDPEIQKSFAARMVSALRNAFGGHAVKR